MAVFVSRHQLVGIMSTVVAWLVAATVATKGASYVNMPFLLLTFNLYNGHVILYILHVIRGILVRFICLN